MGKWILQMQAVDFFYGGQKRSNTEASELSVIFLLLCKNFLHDHEFSHDILCRRAAMTTAEPPEPLDFSAFRIHFIQTNPSADWRPGGEAICVISVICGYEKTKFVFIRVHSWF